jgi:phospholipid/cholesterol/gamma-HCH transport system permease protein
MTAVDDSSTASGEVRFEQPSPGTVQLSFAGSWRLQDQRPAAAGFEEQLGSRTGLARVVFVTTQLRDWDSALLTYLARVVTLCRERNIEVDASGLPEGARRLLELAFAVAPKQDTG